MPELRCKVLIVGGGPGGYVAAIRAGELGLDTVLIEDGQFGGACLHVGCIPSKAIIHAADAAHALAQPLALNAIGLSLDAPTLDFARTIAWKDGIVARLATGVGALLKKAGVRSLKGRATIVDGKSAIAHADTGDQRIACEHLVLATGSEPSPLAALPFDGEDVLSSTEALALAKVPETLAVVAAAAVLPRFAGEEKRRRGPTCLSFAARFSSSAAAPAAMSRRSAPASSASTRC